MVDPVFWIESPFNPLLGALVGVALLLAGRRLFWLLVGVVGFVFGFQLAQGWLGFEEPWLQLLVAAVVGLVGAFLAVLLQRVAIGLAGFLLGGAAAGWAAEVYLGMSGGAAWVVFFVAGILCAILASVLFDLALIVLSSLLGASFVVQAIDASDVLQMGDTARAVTFLVLAGVGLAAQALQPRREDRREERREVARERRRVERLHRQEQRRRS